MSPRHLFNFSFFMFNISRLGIGIDYDAQCTPKEDLPPNGLSQVKIVENKFTELDESDKRYVDVDDYWVIRENNVTNTTTYLGKCKSARIFDILGRIWPKFGSMWA